MELISDKTGSMTFGWVASGVYYTRVSGDISPHLAGAQLKRADTALENQARVHFFADCLDVRSYDLLARGAFARFLLTHRTRFVEIVVLIPAEGWSSAGQALASAVGDPLVLLASASEFMKRLNSVAPGVNQFPASSAKGNAAKDRAMLVRSK